MVVPSNAPQVQTMVDYLTNVRNDVSNSTELDGGNYCAPAQELYDATAAPFVAHPDRCADDVPEPGRRPSVPVVHGVRVQQCGNPTDRVHSR